MRIRWCLSQSPLPQQPPPVPDGRTLLHTDLEETIESRSGGDPHQVRRRNGHWSCSCKAYTKGNRECWAIGQARHTLTQVK